MTTKTHHTRTTTLLHTHKPPHPADLYADHDPSRKLPAELRLLFCNNYGIESSLISLGMNALNKSWATGCALPSPSRPAVRLRALVQRHHQVGWLPQRVGSNKPQRKGHAGTKGEGGGLRREPVVTLLKSHPRSTKSTRGGSDLAPTERPTFLPHTPPLSHMCTNGV